MLGPPFVSGDRSSWWQIALWECGGADASLHQCGCQLHPPGWLPLCWEPCPQLSQLRLLGAAGAGLGCLPEGVVQSGEAPPTLDGAAGHQSGSGPAAHSSGQPMCDQHSSHLVSDVSTVTLLLQGTFEGGTLPSWASTKRPAGAVGTGTGLQSALLHRCPQAQEQGSHAPCPAQIAASLCLPADTHLRSCRSHSAELHLS